MGFIENEQEKTLVSANQETGHAPSKKPKRVWIPVCYSKGLAIKVAHIPAPNSRFLGHYERSRNPPIRSAGPRALGHVLLNRRKRLHPINPSNDRWVRIQRPRVHRQGIVTNVEEAKVAVVRSRPSKEVLVPKKLLGRAHPARQRGEIFFILLFPKRLVHWNSIQNRIDATHLLRKLEDHVRLRSSNRVLRVELRDLRDVPSDGP
mmetsp:Transcript_60389/g.160888  ORF Transcript_60389/g.160888 Transcript_60389/m.160888 type:complete len:205 (-) Transcript_60389:210-824(-)